MEHSSEQCDTKGDTANIVENTDSVQEEPPDNTQTKGGKKDSCKDEGIQLDTERTHDRHEIMGVSHSI